MQGEAFLTEANCARLAAMKDVPGKKVVLLLLGGLLCFAAVMFTGIWIVTRFHLHP